MPRVHATFIVPRARPFAAAARSPVALLRIATVAMVAIRSELSTGTSRCGSRKMRAVGPDSTVSP